MTSNKHGVDESQTNQTNHVTMTLALSLSFLVPHLSVSFLVSCSDPESSIQVKVAQCVCDLILIPVLLWHQRRHKKSSSSSSSSSRHHASDDEETELDQLLLPWLLCIRIADSNRCHPFSVFRFFLFSLIHCVLLFTHHHCVTYSIIHFIIPLTNPLTIHLSSFWLFLTVSNCCTQLSRPPSSKG